MYRAGATGAIPPKLTPPTTPTGLTGPAGDEFFSEFGTSYRPNPVMVKAEVLAERAKPPILPIYKPEIPIAKKEIFGLGTKLVDTIFRGAEGQVIKSFTDDEIDTFKDQV